MNECDVIFQNTSVSGRHAQFTLVEERFYVKDLNSKLGTLLKAEEIVPIQNYVQVQSNMNVYEFVINRS